MTKNPTPTSFRIRKPYDASEPVRISFSKPTMAQQSFKDECDINRIMARYKKTGVIDHVRATQGAYGDFTSVEDYHTSLNNLQAAQSAFMALPAHIRARFDNDPAQLLGFLDDDKNFNEAVSLGLIPQNPHSEQRSESPAESSGKPANPKSTTKKEAEASSNSSE